MWQRYKLPLRGRSSFPVWWIWVWQAGQRQGIEAGEVYGGKGRETRRTAVGPIVDSANAPRQGDHLRMRRILGDRARQGGPCAVEVPVAQLRIGERGEHP